MKNVNILQVVIIGISAIAIVGAVIIFAAYRGGAANRVSAGNVVLWGSIPQQTFNEIINDFKIEDDRAFEGLQYVYKDKNVLEDDLLIAIAEGKGPDLVLLSEKQILTNQRRMKEIPYESFPLRTYQEMFFDESNLLLTNKGILGFPFLVDPLVMYYNKDTLNAFGFSRPPETWTEMLALTPTITQKDSSFNITKSTIALGSHVNITNAKDIFWMLTLQAGNPVIERYLDVPTQTEMYRSIFAESLNFTLSPTYAATNFFVQFSNPTKTVYSWNRSLPNSQTMFVSGDLAFYIGYASELPTIKKINPNLNFDVTVVPQSQSSSRKVTYGSMQVFTIPHTTRNKNGAIAMVAQLTSQKSQRAFSQALGIPSVRRDLLSTSDASSSFENVFNRSAIIAQGILEPDSRQSSVIIEELIDTVVSGQYEISTAINRAQEKLSLLFNE